MAIIYWNSIIYLAFATHLFCPRWWNCFRGLEMNTSDSTCSSWISTGYDWYDLWFVKSHLFGCQEQIREQIMINFSFYVLMIIFGLRKIFHFFVNSTFGNKLPVFTFGYRGPPQNFHILAFLKLLVKYKKFWELDIPPPLEF